MPTIKTQEKVDWTEFQTKMAEFNKAAGSLLFIPIIVIVGICYGLRAGIISGAGKAISMFSEWGE